MNTYKSLCLIPAKASSTRLKKKNILKIDGKELVYYPIKAAQESGLFGKHIYVSTEAEEIRTIALKYGACVPYLRDEKLAHDPYGVVDVVLDFFEKNSGYRSYDNIFVLLPTSPMVIPEDILKAFELYRNGNHKYLMAVTETGHNCLRSVFVKNNQIEPVFADKILKKTQELEKTYRTNAAITIMSVKDFLREKHYFTYPLGAYVMPRERAIDIDTEFDYKLAKLLIEDKCHLDAVSQK